MDGAPGNKKPVKYLRMRKVVIIGPESTGKSSLARSLAAHYNTGWVTEYARTYLLTHGKEYTYEDLYAIALGQLAAEKEMSTCYRDKSCLFIDTDLHVVRVWSEFVFNRCDNRILQHIARQSYDLYLLCNTDLPWEPDELREYPDLETRRRLFHHYHDTLVQQSIPFEVISGTEDIRVQIAIEAVHKHGISK